MKKQEKNEISMKWRMIGIMLMCWLLPFCLIIGVAGYYILSNRYGTVAQGVVDQVVYDGQICVERLNYGINASRKATYDQTLEKAWREYSRGNLSYGGLYTASNDYLNKEYRQNQCFSTTILWCYEEPERMNCSVYNNAAGGTYQQVQTYWREDHERIKAFLSTLDTALGYINLDGRIYMVRNLLDNSYYQFGALIMRLDKSYCFGPLIDSPQGENVLVRLDGQAILLKGGDIEEMIKESSSTAQQTGYSRKNGNLYVYDTQKEEYFTLSVMMQADKRIIQAPFYGYPFVVAGMLLFLVPLLLILLRVFNRNVTKPIADMMEGADQIETGNLGYQIKEEPENLEFKYLMESFNQMSERLKYQFDHIYEEEIALRDARIMALQSHINPHFMNNTLEIINWEARLADDVKVCQMLEALSTMLNAAMDRKHRPLIHLSEEMMYVDAYLFIIRERLGKRLTVEKKISPETLDCYVPRLVLQPLLENAVEHGINPVQKGTIIIRAYREQDRLLLEIENDGVTTYDDLMKIQTLLSDANIVQHLFAEQIKGLFCPAC